MWERLPPIVHVDCTWFEFESFATFIISTNRNNFLTLRPVQMVSYRIVIVVALVYSIFICFRSGNLRFEAGFRLTDIGEYAGWITSNNN